MERKNASPLHYVSAALIGIGAAVIGFRVVVLWLHAGGGVAMWFAPVVGGIFAVAGIHLARSVQGPDGNGALKALAGIAGFALACFVIPRVMPPVKYNYPSDWTPEIDRTFETATPVDEEVPAEPVEDVVEDPNVGKLHIAIEIPTFHVDDRRASAISLATDDGYVSIEEMTPGVTWDANEIKARAPQFGFDIATVKPALPDGRRMFITSSDDSAPGLTGWFAVKKCAGNDIVVMTAAASKVEQKAILAAFRKARCTEELKEY